MNRGHYDTWDAEHQRRHRLYRAFQELLLHRSYVLTVSRDTLLTVLVVEPIGSAGPAITEDAETFRRQYNAELVAHHDWLEGKE